MVFPYFTEFSVFNHYLIYSQGINTNTNKYFRELERPMTKHQPAQCPTSAVKGKQKKSGHFPPGLQPQWKAAETLYCFKPLLVQHVDQHLI